MLIISDGPPRVLRLRRALRLSFLVPLTTIFQNVSAQGFIEDSTASLLARNTFVERDYKDGGAKALAREWAEGFVLDTQSGYTEGPVGFGFDAKTYLGVKLDSSAAHAGAELLPVSAKSGEPAGEYSRIAPTAKARFSKTSLRVGDQQFTMPFLISSPARMFPSTFRGYYIQSKEIDNVALHLGYIDRINKRNSSNYESLSVASPNGRFKSGQYSSHLTFVGADYNFSPSITFRAYHTVLEDIYEQNFLGATTSFPLYSGMLRSEFRASSSSEDGAAVAGRVDNIMFNTQQIYKVGSHSIALGYTQLQGKTAIPYVAGTEILGSGDLVMSSDFLNQNERTLHAAYIYDFASQGLPGLYGRAAYMNGRNIKLARPESTDRAEREVQFEVGYAVQSGTFKNLSVRWRQSIYRNDFPDGSAFRAENQTRIYVDYRIPLF